MIFSKRTKRRERFLVRKAVAIIGYFGGLRCAELVALNFEDVSISKDCITVFIRSSKTDPQGKSKFYFTIPKDNDASSLCAYSIIQKYFDAVPKKSGRFFINCNTKSNSFAGQPMGRNTIGAVPKFIASYLELDNADKYTGHCFRRSSATALADSGATLTTLKRQYRWKSDSVALDYVDQSKTHKMDVAKSLKITTCADINTTNKEDNATKIVHINNCSNVIINL